MCHVDAATSRCGRPQQPVAVHPRSWRGCQIIGLAAAHLAGSACLQRRRCGFSVGWLYALKLRYPLTMGRTFCVYCRRLVRETNVTIQQADAVSACDGVACSFAILHGKRHYHGWMTSGAASAQVRAAAQVLFDTKHFVKNYGGTAAPPGWDGALRPVLVHLGSTRCPR